MTPLEIALVAALAVTQALDWYSTRTILAKGGIEQNPIARQGMEVFGIDGFLGIKAVAVTAIGWFLVPHPWILGLLVLFYVGVIAHNWRSL